MDSLKENSAVEIHHWPAHDPDFDVWDPPFERWLRMADQLLSDWPGLRSCNSSVPPAPHTN